MSDLTDKQRDLVAKAKLVEAERIETYAQAVEENIADLMPYSWEDLDGGWAHGPVEICLTLGLTASDADTLDERELRNVIRWIGQRCDDERAAQDIPIDPDED